MNHMKLRALCEGAIMVAAGTALGFIKLFELPQGGSIGIGMLPLLFYCVRWGWKEGLLASFAYGLLQLIFDGAYAWGWTSMLLDYILAYGVLGFAGLFAHKKSGIFTGTVVGCVLRFIVHFISGITIYRIYAPTEILGTVFDEPNLYSLAYNGSYMLPNTILALAIAGLLYAPLKKFYVGEDIPK